MEARDYCQNTSLGQKHIARRATDRCCDVATYTSYTSRTHKSNTSRTQVVHKSYIDVVYNNVAYNNVAYTMGSVLRPLLDVLQHVGFLLAQYDFDNMQCFRYSKPSRILVIKKQIDFKTSVTKIPLLPVLSAAVRKVWAGNRKFVSWASISQLDLNGFFAKRDGGKEAGSTHSMDKCLHYTNQCDRCDEAFSTVKNLKKHTRTQHKCLRYTAWVNFNKTKSKSLKSMLIIKKQTNS